MDSIQSETLAILRLLIGFLGEKDHFGWWQSSFFTQGSRAFLSPIFSRTQLLAQCNGVTQAAARMHDERIGVGFVYHMFRLPEDMEQSIQSMLHDERITLATQRLLLNQESALEALRAQSEPKQPANVGPIRVGDVAALRDPQAWRMAAGYYRAAFESGQPIFPYFTDVS